MINRQNWQDVNRFLAFQEGTQQNDYLTVQRIRRALRHLLEWSDSIAFGNVTRKEPTFPAYMAKRRKANSGCEKDLQICRQFFTFARSEFSPRYKEITVSWIKTIRPSKQNSTQSRLRKHSFYTLGDVLKIASLWESAKTIELKRDIAAVCFLFLSGMRISAFMSLPIECVDIANNEIMQLPEMGVMTKNRKAAVTYLLQISELLEVVKGWDEFIRLELSKSDLWYPVMGIHVGTFKKGINASLYRRQNFTKVLRDLCVCAGVAYLSPHKLRHGHVVYALKNVKDIAGLKAVSQNVMHASIQITDSIYGNLSDGDVKRVVSAIGQAVIETPADNPPPAADMQALVGVFTLLLKDNPEAMKLLANFGKPTTDKKGKVKK